MQPGVSVAQLARENNINDNLLFTLAATLSAGAAGCADRCAGHKRAVTLALLNQAPSTASIHRPFRARRCPAACGLRVLPAGTLRISGKLTPRLLQMLIREMQGVRKR